ncbi:MAG: M20/M25/M40 family metallo-hydrolase [Burkholderiales bacterium]|nr:M20/M25/M40 family metallo-hydrolase [Bacteroidia bacterium]
MIKSIYNKFIFLLIACGSIYTSHSQVNPTKVLSEYIQIKSVSGNEKKAGLYMKKLCEQFGLHTTVFSDSDSSYNFCASLVPLELKLPSILLINHIDVVPVEENTSWKHPAFSGKIDRDTIYGRGSIDMKGLAVMQVFALKRIKEMARPDSLTKNLVLLFLSGEETGGLNGAKKIIQPEILDQLKPLVVFGEGGGGLKNVIDGKENELCFFVSNSEKKSIWIKLEATVKSHGHGSVPSSKTANKILLKAIQKIENTEERIIVDNDAKKTLRALGDIMGGYKGFILKHFHWWIIKPLRKKIIHSNEALQTLVTNSYQLTQIQNPKGGSVNQVSQTASAYYDCRLLPNKSERPLLLKWLFRIIDPRIKISIIDESPEAEPSKLNIHFEHMKASILTVFPKAHVIPLMFPATTDNSYFRSADIPSFGVLPFELNREMVESVHANNEKLPVVALEQGINVYVELLKYYTK